MAEQKYYVCPGRIATSRADGKNYYENEEINLDHCTPEEIQNLINIGLVTTKKPKAEQSAETQKTEVKNG